MQPFVRGLAGRLLWVAASLVWVGSLSADPQVEELDAQWRAQRGEIHTAHIKCRCMSNGAGDLRALSKKEVREALVRAGLDRGALDWNVLVQGLFANPPPDPPYAIEELWFDGDKVRVVNSWNGVRETDVLRRPEGDAWYLRTTGQVALYRTRESSLRVRNLNDFRFLPQLELSGTVSERGPEGEIVLRRPGLQIVVSEGDRYPLDFLTERQQRLQRNLVEVSGITFPLLSIRLDFRDDRLSYLSIFECEDVRLNEEIPADVFTMSVPKGFVVADFRETPGGHSYRVTREIPSALALQPPETRAAAPPTDRSESSAALWVGMGAAGVLTAVVLGWLVRKQVWA